MIEWFDVSKLKPADNQACYITLGVPKGSLAISATILGPILYDAKYNHFIDLFAESGNGQSAGETGMCFPANHLIDGKALQWTDAKNINMPEV